MCRTDQWKSSIYNFGTWRNVLVWHNTLALTSFVRCLFACLVDQCAFLCYSLLYKQNVVVYQRVLKTTSHVWNAFIFHGQDSTEAAIKIENTMTNYSPKTTFLRKRISFSGLLWHMTSRPTLKTIILWYYCLINHVSTCVRRLILPWPSSTMKRQSRRLSLFLRIAICCMQLQLLVEKATQMAPKHQQLKLDSLSHWSECTPQYGRSHSPQNFMQYYDTGRRQGTSICNARTSNNWRSYYENRRQHKKDLQ